jgi:hypothetical protein
MRTTATALYPFVPSGPQLGVALAFFAELGFEKLWEHDGLAGLRWDGAYFILQSIDVPEWQKNQMLTIEVDDIDGYWSEIEPKDLATRFPGIKLRPPTDFPGAERSTSSTPAGFAGM